MGTFSAVSLTLSNGMGKSADLLSYQNKDLTRKILGNIVFSFITWVDTAIVPLRYHWVHDWLDMDQDWIAACHYIPSVPTSNVPTIVICMYIYIHTRDIIGI